MPISATPKVPLTTQPYHLRLLEALKKHGEDRPDQPCLIDYHTGHKTYHREVVDTAKAIGVHLHSIGIKKGDFVCAVMENGWEYLATVIGVNLNGAAISGANAQCLECK